MKRVVLPLVVGLVGFGFAPADNSQASPSFSLPAHASEVAPGVFFLGTAVDNGRVVEGFAFEQLADAPPPRGARGEAKPPWAGGPGSGGDDGDSDASSCYSYIANGAKWRNAEHYFFNNYGIAGVADIEFRDAMESWETAAGYYDIIGNLVPTTDSLSADTSSTDGRNEIYFAPIDDNGVLGYTIVWYTRGGPPRNRQIVEADMVIDTEWNWYEGHEVEGTIGGNQVHFWGVAVHEAGHYMGMGHTDGSQCGDQTMYPYLSAGDDSKESLDLGDIAGIQSLYP